jgi:glycosyltransferase involved in cell wall biosynthesis
MRICFVAYKFYESTPRFMQFASICAGRGWLVDVLCLRRPGQLCREVVDGVNIFRIQERICDERAQLSYLLRIFCFCLRSFGLLSLKQLSKGYDLVTFFTVPDFLVFAAFLPRILGVPVVIDYYDLVPEFYESKFHRTRNRHSIAFFVLLWLERLSIAFSRHIIVANHVWMKRLISRSCRPEKCTAIPYCSNPKIYFPRSRSRTDGSFIIIYPGTLNWHQGVDIAIRAFAKLLKQWPDAELRIYGEGPEKPRLIDLVIDLGISERVAFGSMIPAWDIAAIIASSDLLVVPKRASSLFGNEASSTKILDCMQLGIPVLAARTMVESFYFDSSMVRFFASEDEDDLVENLLVLIRDPELREQLTRNAKIYSQEHSWDKMSYGYLSLIESLVHRSSKVTLSKPAH